MSETYKEQPKDAFEFERNLLNDEIKKLQSRIKELEGTVNKLSVQPLSLKEVIASLEDKFDNAVNKITELHGIEHQEVLIRELYQYWKLNDYHTPVQKFYITRIKNQ